MSMVGPSHAAEEELSGLVRRYQMSWHTRFERGVVGTELVPIGFVVEITATHDAPPHPPMAGCEECIPVRRALARVAHAVLPLGEHASWYDVAVAEGELQYDPSRHNRPELYATIAVLHKGTVNRPPDECERACLDEIRGHLVALGAHER